MRDRDLDEILREAAGPSEVERALLDRVSTAICSSLRPVRPLPPAWALASGLFLICGFVAFAGAARLGLSGIRNLNALEIALIFTVLGIFTWLAATGSVREMTPGSRRGVAPATLLAIGSSSVVAVFVLLFHDYRVDRFVPQGLTCLSAGALHSLAAGFAGWLLLRRGFAVSPVSAGLAAGILASLAGLAMLELHCPNVQVLHLIVWHTALIPLCALAGAVLAWTTHRLGRNQ